MTTAAAGATAGTVGEAVRTASVRLGAAGIETARLDAWLLAAHATGQPRDRLRLHPETPLDRAALAAFEALVARRAEERVPVARLVGEREFWSLPFRLSAATLDPRPDSETLIEAALSHVDGSSRGRSAPLRVIDLGTGTGCLLLALLHELPGAWGLGTDRSAAAIGTARANAGRLGLADRASFVVADWAAPLAAAPAGRFDIVLSNPPYIERAAIAGLAPEVARHDPALALDGGADGMDAYRAIVRTLPALVAAGGVAILEIGHDQAEAVGALLRSRGMERIDLRKDLGGRARCIVAAGPA